MRAWGGKMWKQSISGGISGVKHPILCFNLLVIFHLTLMILEGGYPDIQTLIPVPQGYCVTGYLCDRVPFHKGTLPQGTQVSQYLWWTLSKCNVLRMVFTVSHKSIATGTLNLWGLYLRNYCIFCSGVKSNLGGQYMNFLALNWRDLVLPGCGAVHSSIHTTLRVFL